jgi:hypothetical protein
MIPAEPLEMEVRIGSQFWCWFVLSGRTLAKSPESEYSAKLSSCPDQRLTSY